MSQLALLSEEVQVSERTLRRAVRQGTLHARRATPRTLDLPLSERRYVRRSWPLIAKLRNALRTEHNVRFALLFGSAATGTDTPASDVDVLVHLRDPDFERVIDLSARLGAAIGRPVEVVRLEDAEAEPSFLADVLAEGRVLVDRDEAWGRVRRRRSSLARDAQRRERARAAAALAGIDELLDR
ncbi:MAG: nucleotidyltransferase domain-containing protein [Thermoleophilaceae bacterium]